MNGNVLQELVSSEKYDLRGARLLCGSMNTGAFDIFINYRHVSFYGNTEVDENSIYANRYDRTNPQNTVDFLCHYLPEENRLSAQFGIKNLDEIYAIYEFSNQYVVETLMSTYGVSEDDLKSETIIVDKKTWKGCRFDGIRMPSGLLLKMYTSMRFYRDGYLLANVFGSELDRQIEKLDRSTLTSSEQKELERFKNFRKEEGGAVLLATGKLVGEGFDNPQLDTLFLTMPISDRSLLIQYVGRLHRLCDQKHEVRVIDYRDSQERRLEKMFAKRLKIYKAIGYEEQFKQKDDFLL